MEKIFSKKINVIILLVIIAFVSLFIFSPIASSPEFHANTIKKLDDKKITVMELTAATATTSLAISAIPSDITSPLANQIIELSEYLLIIIGVIFLEKIILTVTGYISFSFLIPLACLLYGIYVYVKKDMLRNIAIKLVLFSLVIFIVVPVSVKISNLIENTYNCSVNQTIEDTKKNDKLENDSDKNEGGWNAFISKTKDLITSVGDNISELKDNGEKVLSNFIDAIAILLITSCVIPIIVLLIFIWIIKSIFGINIPIKRIKIENNKND